MSVLKEFREFALKGSVVDLAVGVIIGAAFNGIVQSLVNDLIMPPIGWIAGGLDFSDLAIKLPRSPLAPDTPKRSASPLSQNDRTASGHRETSAAR